MPDSLTRDLERLLGADAIVAGAARAAYLHDSTEMQGLRGHADAVVAPSSVEQVQQLVQWCYRHEVAMVPRGGGTGFAGGAVPDGGVVIGLERLARVRRLEPHLWRALVEAGVTTAQIQRLARESGLFLPPDPGAAEQSQIGGNIATNAGGPRSFKYGVTGAWVSGVEAVVADGELVGFGNHTRKDVAGYDLRSLMVGSEGTLGIITGAWLRLIPAPEAQIPVVAVFADAADGVAAMQAVYADGVPSAVLDYLDAGALALAGPAFPWPLPDRAAFMVITEADGSRAAADAVADGLREALSDGALATWTLPALGDQRELWRWRSGVSFAVEGHRGGKMSEDVAVPFDRLAEALEMADAAAREVGLPLCSWGHGGDGNLHLTFMIDAGSPDEVARAARGARLLFRGAIDLGGTITGEHGVGLVKRDELPRQLTPVEMELQTAVKRLFDPRNLFNPGKKVVLGGA
jgi:glycolate oxidase subunit GlcD